MSQSTIRTVIVAVVTSNTRLARVRGNVLLEAERTGLRVDSVVNVSQLYTVDKDALTEWIGALPLDEQRALDAGLRLLLGL